jgi:hypothetical protein
VPVLDEKTPDAAALLPVLINSSSSAVQKILRCQTGPKQIQVSTALICCWSKQITEVLKRERKKELACLLLLDMVASSPLPNRTYSSPSVVDPRRRLQVTLACRWTAAVATTLLQPRELLSLRAEKPTAAGRSNTSRQDRRRQSKQPPAAHRGMEEVAAWARPSAAVSCSHPLKGLDG